MKSGAWAEALLWLAAALFFAASRGFELPLPHFTPGARAADSLRVVTWNVGGDDDGESHALAEADVDAVVAALVELDPDLVFLQEVGDGAPRNALARALGHDWSLLPGRGDVLALATSGALERWPAPLARSLGVTWRIGGKSVAAVGMHASAFSAAARQREIGPTLDALLEQESDAQLFVGDLNLDLDLDKRSDLFTSDLHADVETYNYVVSQLEDAGRSTGPTAEPDRRLDYVFVSPELAVRTAGPWKGRRVGTMDHDPMVVDLAFARRR